MNCFSRCHILFAVLFTTFSISAAEPYLGYIYPAGITPGTTNTFLIGGTGLGNIQSLYVSGGGISVIKITDVPNFPPPDGRQRRHLVRWLDALARGETQEPEIPANAHVEEWRSNRWWRVLGSLNIYERALVERDLYTDRNPLQATPTLRKQMIVTLAAVPDTPPGMRTLVAWGKDGMSAPRPFAITRAVRHSEPLFSPPHRPLLNPPVYDFDKTPEHVFDGRILPGEMDTVRIRLSSGKRYFFQTIARALEPYIGDAVPGFFNPLVSFQAPSGTGILSADDTNRFNPDPSGSFVAPESGLYTLTIRDTLFRGRPDFVYALALSESTPIRTQSIPTRAETLPTTTYRGIVYRPNYVSSCTFEITNPGDRILEVFARRLGSPLDAVLTLRPDAPKAKPLAVWDDNTNSTWYGAIPQSELDPYGRWHFEKPGRYRAEITDRTGHGDTNYFWHLTVRSPTPDFQVMSTRSTLAFSPRHSGQSVLFRLVRREGFNQNVKLIFPDELTAWPRVITQGVDEVKCYLRAQSRTVTLPHPVTIFAEATVNGRNVRHPVIPCDEYEQAFAWKHLVPAESFLMASWPIPQKPKPKPGKNRPKPPQKSTNQTAR